MKKELFHFKSETASYILVLVMEFHNNMYLYILLYVRIIL